MVTTENLTITRKTNEVVIVKGYESHSYLSLPANLPIKMIKATISSHDQGWTTWPDGESWTWWEIVVLNSEGKEKLKWGEKYKNETANFKYQTRTGIIEDENFLNKIKEGDIVKVELRSEYPKWEFYANHGSISIVFNKPLSNDLSKLWCTDCKGQRLCVNEGCNPSCKHECAECRGKNLTYIHLTKNDSQERENQKVVWEQIKAELEANKTKIEQEAKMEVATKQ